jgi:transcriptional regulator with XRE-family HTH domain
MTYDMHFADRIRAFMERRGLTQAEFGKLVGASQQKVWHSLQGRHPRGDYRDKVMKILDADEPKAAKRKEETSVARAIEQHKREIARLLNVATVGILI